jgi:hypothetical protein
MGIQIPARDFCFSQTVQLGSWAHLAHGYQGSFPGLKQLGCVNYSPSSSTEVENDWSCTSAGAVLAIMAWTRTTITSFTCLHLYWF